MKYPINELANSKGVSQPVAYFDWLPTGATHIAEITVKTKSGGRLEMWTYAFKYDNKALMVYTTDNDNEYPGWREAKECFYHLNFAVFPIPTTPPAAQRQWVGLAHEEIAEIVTPYWDKYCDFDFEQFAQDIEAKLRSKNNG